MNEPQPEHTDSGRVVEIGRYALHRQIARGGMATIHVARLVGDEGFSRIVAAKRLLPEFAEDAEFVAMFLDEARIASKVHHQNVVPVLDLVTQSGEVVLIQEYVHGVPLHWLMARARQSQGTMKSRIPIKICVGIACQTLAGLHAAHETVDELGAPLEIVHRDVSPQNVMIASDGTARLLDFGVAKATMAAHITREGTYKGKLAYSAPEQLRGAATRRSDLYALSVMLWELLAGHRMHRACGEAELVATTLSGALPTIIEALAAEHAWDTMPVDQRDLIMALEPIVMRGLARDAADRWATAYEMEEALANAVRPASSNTISTWMKTLGSEYLDKQDSILAAEEHSWRNNSNKPWRTGVNLVPRLPTGPAADTPSVSQSSMPLPIAPPKRGVYSLVALLSVLVIALAVGIVLVVTSNPQPRADAAPAALVQPAPQPPAQPPQPPPQQPAAAAAPVKTQSVQPTTITTPPPAPREELAIGNVDVQVAPTPPAAKAAPVVAPRPAPPPPPRYVQQQPVRRVAPPAAPPKPPVETRRPDPAPATTPPPQTPATTSTTPTANCSPPYYYEGTKKVFKPACL